MRSWFTYQEALDCLALDRMAHSQFPFDSLIAMFFGMMSQNRLDEKPGANHVPSWFFRDDLCSLRRSP
ncbi:hypothetical protein JG687_00008297 [Phytophthora cactorum]|uniref:Uncharacterized protein n=1 Tax=Phytophthora cactorum TaxID=29920 RepID=A0A8T1UFY0_9STRA|nr:hypothetical protein GQ600_5024 [Phytophthora cactorum]KAG6960296.1 hypothetical protein JG687_00008297 [Phytophthora cactorum]